MPVTIPVMAPRTTSTRSPSCSPNSRDARKNPDPKPKPQPQTRFDSPKQVPGPLHAAQIPAAFIDILQSPFPPPPQTVEGREGEFGRRAALAAHQLRDAAPVVNHPGRQRDRKSTR